MSGRRNLAELIDDGNESLSGTGPCTGGETPARAADAAAELRQQPKVADERNPSTVEEPGVDPAPRTPEPAVRAPQANTARSLRRTLVITAVLDLAVLCFSLMVAWNLRQVIDMWSTAPEGAVYARGSVPWIIGLWLVVLALQGAHSPRSFAQGSEEFRLVAVASFVTAGLVSMGCYLLQLPLSRGFVLLAFTIGLPLLLLERYVVRRSICSLRRAGRMVHRVVAIGGPSGLSEVVDALQRSPEVGYRIVGAALPEGVTVDPERFTVPVLGLVADTRRLCQEVGADTVLIARGGYLDARDLRRIAWSLEGSDINLIVVPSLTDVAGPRIRMRPVAGLPLLHLEQPQASEASGWGKRVFDIVGAAFALLLLSPLCALVTLLVKLEDHGPIFFVQPRIGRDGHTFGCFKFRSMFVDADRQERSLRDQAGHSGALWKMPDDPRITRVGRFIRRYSIDEVPQLINVLRGEMSLVGPRPQQAWEVQTYTDWEHRRLRVRPGMTGLWQVSGRSQLSFDEAIRLDLYYVDNWSMTQDLLIMAKTVQAVLGSSGAY